MKNTYFFAFFWEGVLIWDSNMQTLKSLLILALQSCGLAYCIRAQKHLAALKQTSNKIRVLGLLFHLVVILSNQF